MDKKFSNHCWERGRFRKGGGEKAGLHQKKKRKRKNMQRGVTSSNFKAGQLTYKWAKAHSHKRRGKREEGRR